MQQNQQDKSQSTILKTYELNHLERQFADILTAYHTNAPEQLQQIVLEELCKLLKLEKADYELDNNYPNYTLKHLKSPLIYTLNLQKGQIFNENHLRLSSMPLALQNNPILKHLHINLESLCFISQDEKSIEWEDGSVRVRVKDTQAQQYELESVEKQWEINQQKDWYRYNPNGRIFLPEPFKDASADFWQNDKNAFIAQNNKPLFYKKEYNDIEQLDADNQPNGRFLTPVSTLTAAFNAFEDPKFIQATQTKAPPNKAYIFLQRYGLEFQKQGDSIQLETTGETLVILEEPPFKPEVAQIILCDSENNHRCLVPVQPFYLDPKTSQTKGHLYQFTHDISGVIAQEKLGGEIYRDFWIYRHAENTISYTLNDAGQPEANNAAEALYLAYLYLATHEPEKAWNTLNIIQ